MAAKKDDGNSVEDGGRQMRVAAKAVQRKNRKEGCLVQRRPRRGGFMKMKWVARARQAFGAILCCYVQLARATQRKHGI